jgi:ketosteroid isomerase-like protein
MDAAAADREFFTMLLDGDVPGLERALTDDFLIVDVMSGAVADKAAFLEAVGSGTVTFAAIDVVAPPVERRYGDAVAVLVGETRMRGAFGGRAFSAHSRYTHVFDRSGDRWRLASAQGTPIAG